MYPFDIKNLGGSFKRYFEVVPALTNELREHVYRIRHQVYCEELKFEAKRPDGRETDDYDAHSLHCLIRSVKNSEYVGCTRLVLARPGAPYHPLPFESTCADTLDRSILDPQVMPRHRIAEVSRLGVISRYRLRRGERNMLLPITDDSFGGEVQPRFPYIPVGLYLGTIELAAVHGIDTLFVLTEPRLAKHFAKLGVEIKQIGGAVEHRGIRVPSVIGVRSVIDGLNFIMRSLYDVVAEEIRQGVRAQQGTRPPEFLDPAQ